MTALKKLSIDQNSNDFLIENLRFLLHKHSINEAELARQTNIPQPTLHKIISGKTSDPRISTLQILAGYFNITVDDLCSRAVSHSFHPKPQQGSIPILTWHECIEAPRLSRNHRPRNQGNWIDTNNLHCDNAFALISKPSMEPRFPRGSILIFGYNTNTSDGDIVLVHYPNTQEATIRELFIDGPDQQLLSINKESTRSDKFDQEKTVLGTLFESRYRHKERKQQI